MKTVVLDGYSLNSGDLSWNGFLSLTDDFQVYDRTPFEEIIKRADGAEIILTNKTVLNKEILENLPNLKYVGVLATGTNVVDLNFAASRGIIVTNIPSYGTDSVAQTVFALILEVVVGAGRQSDSVKRGKWTECADFCYYEKGLFELKGKTLGIIGMGSIGKKVRKIAEAFEMKVVFSDPFYKGAAGDASLSLERLFAESDIITLNCPLTEENKGIINSENIRKMKDGVIIINTARGPLIDENALAEGLNSGKVAGAGVDVLEIEPPRENNPLLTAKNVIITPHQAWAAKEARERLMDIAVKNLDAFLKGKPVNVVNKK